GHGNGFSHDDSFRSRDTLPRGFCAKKGAGSQV
ncbi:MAG: hypothetical protein ACI9ME_002061, partial [Ilumatobacter sp.]